MIALGIRLSLRHKRLVYAVFALAWASGTLWLAFHHFLGSAGEFGPEPHPLEKWWLRLHGLAAMLTLMAIGSLATVHMRLAWQRRKNLSTGLGMLAAMLWLTATGYALYYFSSDANGAWLPLLHWTVGLALPAFLVAHIAAGRRRTLRPHARSPVVNAPAARPHATSQPAHARRQASR